MLRTSKVWTISAILIITSGCCTIPVEPPICLPDRPVLEPITREEQLLIKNIDEDLLRRIGSNDAALKGYIKEVEGYVQAHDAILGECT